MHSADRQVCCQPKQPAMLRIPSVASSCGLCEESTWVPLLELPAAPGTGTARLANHPSASLRSPVCACVLLFPICSSLQLRHKPRHFVLEGLPAAHSRKEGDTWWRERLQLRSLPLGHMSHAGLACARRAGRRADTSPTAAPAARLPGLVGHAVDACQLLLQSLHTLQQLAVGCLCQHPWRNGQYEQRGRQRASVPGSHGCRQSQSSSVSPRTLIGLRYCTSPTLPSPGWTAALRGNVRPPPRGAPPPGLRQPRSGAPPPWPALRPQAPSPPPPAWPEQPRSPSLHTGRARALKVRSGERRRRVAAAALPSVCQWWECWLSSREISAAGSRGLAAAAPRPKLEPLNSDMAGWPLWGCGPHRLGRVTRRMQKKGRKRSRWSPCQEETTKTDLLPSAHASSVQYLAP